MVPFSDIRFISGQYLNNELQEKLEPWNAAMHGRITAAYYLRGHVASVPVALPSLASHEGPATASAARSM